jgi:hypothetical protein
MQVTRSKLQTSACWPQVHKGGVAAVAVVGVVTAFFAGIVAGNTNCKQISDGMVEGYSYMQFKDHSDKNGYQHAVRVVPHGDPAVSYLMSTSANIPLNCQKATSAQYLNYCSIV